MSDEQELSEYTVTIGGIDHTMMLTEDDAARYGDNAKKGGSKQADPPANKSRT
jgi:hypothetical protein